LRERGEPTNGATLTQRRPMQPMAMVSPAVTMLILAMIWMLFMELARFEAEETFPPTANGGGGVSGENAECRLAQDR
jgi:hypothetical protein